MMFCVHTCSAPSGWRRAARPAARRPCARAARGPSATGSATTGTTTSWTRPRGPPTAPPTPLWKLLTVTYRSLFRFVCSFYILLQQKCNKNTHNKYSWNVIKYNLHLKKIRRLKFVIYLCLLSTTICVTLLYLLYLVSLFRLVVAQRHKMWL